jgi:hypothetical protein
MACRRAWQTMHDEWLGGLCQFGDRAGQDGLLSGPSLSVRSGVAPRQGPIWWMR